MRFASLVEMSRWTEWKILDVLISITKITKFSHKENTYYFKLFFLMMEIIICVLPRYVSSSQWVHQRYKILLFSCVIRYSPRSTSDNDFLIKFGNIKYKVTNVPIFVLNNVLDK